MCLILVAAASCRRFGTVQADVLAGHGLFGDGSVHDVTISVFFRTASGGAGGGLWRDPVAVEGGAAERVAHHAGSFTTSALGELVFLLDNSYSWLDEKDVDLQVSVGVGERVGDPLAVEAAGRPADAAVGLQLPQPVGDGGADQAASGSSTPAAGPEKPAAASEGQVERRVKPRTIVIAGATSRRGAALVRLYAAQGHTVYGCARRSPLLDVSCCTRSLRLQDSLRDQPQLTRFAPQSMEQELRAGASTRDGAVQLVAIDASDDAAVAAWSDAVNRGQKARAPDLVIVNADESPEKFSGDSPWCVPVADFDASIDANVKALMNMCRHFLPPMISRGSGVVVALSSGPRQSEHVGAS
eukprot:SAG31_NODE_485_length_15021_cov_9.439791_14_plen_356_part_00